MLPLCCLRGRIFKNCFFFYGVFKKIVWFPKKKKSHATEGNQAFAAWGFYWLFLRFDPLLCCFYFPQLFGCFLCVNTFLGVRNMLLWWPQFLLRHVLTTDKIYPMWKIILNVCVHYTRANPSLLFFSFQGIYKYLERSFSDFKQRGFVVGYDTRGQVTSNCSSKKYEYWLHLQD